MTEPDTRPRISVCGIGASAGGVEALQQFFLGVAPDLGLAYVVIVHLAPDHKSELPGILSRCTSMPVVQVGAELGFLGWGDQQHSVAAGAEMRVAEPLDSF